MSTDLGDKVVATLVAAGWRHGPVIASMILMPDDDRRISVMVSPDRDSADYGLDIGPRDQRFYESRSEMVTTLRMRTRHADEVLAVLRALGHLSGAAS